MSSLQYVASNFGNTTLAGSLTALSTSFTVYTGQGSRLPVINDGGTDNNQYTQITLQKTDGTKEIVNVVRHDTGSDSCTIGVPGTVTGSVSGRAQDGTSATTWAIGDVVSCRPTASLMEEAVNLGAKIDASDAKTAIHDDDTFGVSDSEASALTKKTTWANIKALLTTLFNTLYLPLAGGTLTGNVTVNGHVTLGAGKTMIYEGTTDDAFELTVSGGDPTADRTVTFPDRSGTLALTSDSVITNDFRLTLTSATPVTTADVTGATTVYCAPYKGNRISLYSGGEWVVRQSAEFSLALGTLTSGKPYDVFCYDNAGTPTLEFLAWTDDTTRATALAYQDGVLVKNGAATRRYLGTFYTTSTTETEDSAAKRYLWNYYHRAARAIRNSFAADRSTASGSYTELNSEIRCYFLLGASEDGVTVGFNGTQLGNSGGIAIANQIAFDSTSSGEVSMQVMNSTTNAAYPTCQNIASGAKLGLSAGAHYVTVLGKTGSGTAIWTSSDSGNTSKSSIVGSLLG